MKKEILLIFILVLLAVNVSAISSNIKDSYEKKETIIGELSGSILAPISRDQVNLVRDGHIDVAFDYDIKQLGNKYYIWLTAPQTQGNYTLIIEDILTNEQGSQTEVDYQKNFIVTSISTDYSIKPGLVFATGDFFITSTLYSEAENSITVDFPSSRSVILQQGENRVDFSIDSVVGTQLITLNFGKYAVPAYIVGEPANNSINQSVTNQTSNQTSNLTSNNTTTNMTTNQTVNSTNYSLTNSNSSFTVSPQTIKSTILVSEKPFFPFQIINNENNTIEVYLSFNHDIFMISPDANLSIPPNSSIQLNLSLKNNSAAIIRDAIIISSSSKSEYIILEFSFTTNENETSTEYFASNSSSSASLLHCSEIPSGTLCIATGEVCDGRTLASREGLCCIGSCKVEKPASKAWIGYLIIAIVIVALLIIYMKYKKTKSPVNPMSSIGKPSFGGFDPPGATLPSKKI